MRILFENILHAEALQIVVHVNFMITHLFSLGFDFHMSVDFSFKVSFSHIFSVLHLNSIQTSWFSLLRYNSQLTGEKFMKLSIYTSTLKLPWPVSAQSAFCTLTIQLKTKLECLRLLVLDWFDCSEKASWKALTNWWGHLEFNATFSSGFWYWLLGRLIQGCSKCSCHQQIGVQLI